MERREGIDQPNQEAFAAFAQRADEGPVYMLNLLEFRPDGGAERYVEYGGAVAPLFARAGGKPIFAGRPSESLIGEGSWDLMVLVSYPTRQAFLDMVSSPEYQDIEHLRTESLVRSELRAMDAIDTAALGVAS
jgi:uncharacterized protein (DUF1330 family)